MRPTILRTNATAVYRFLSLLRARLADGEELTGRTILDCGAGGRIPPVSVFAEQGMRTFGIDISVAHLEAARAFVEETGLDIDLREADMRELPFPDATFDYVYEHFSMCHLSKADTATAIGEMRRVLRPDGMAFLGVISAESWPPSAYGEERAPGERWIVEGGEERRHTMFTDEESANLVAGWDIVAKERMAFHHGGDEISAEAWDELRAESTVPFTAEAWAREYARRSDYVRYVHAYYFLEKPGD